MPVQLAVVVTALLWPVGVVLAAAVGTAVGVGYVCARRAFWRRQGRDR